MGDTIRLMGGLNQFIMTADYDQIRALKFDGFFWSENIEKLSNSHELYDRMKRSAYRRWSHRNIAWLSGP